MAGFFGFFDYTKPGKGIRKDEPAKTGVALYFDMLLRRFWKLMSLNLIYLVASLPAIVIGWFISTYYVTWVATVAGVNVKDTVSTLSLLCIIMTIVFLQACGSGPATAAMSYVARKYVNDTHSWVWSDFIDNIKSNFKQGIGVYIINVFVILMCIFGFMFYSYVMQNTIAYILRIIVVLITVIFLMMQMYTYQLMAGFELRFKHIYKNAFLLTVAKLPWNVLSAAVVIAIMYGAYSLTMSIPIVGILVVALLLFSLMNFTQIFMTNNIVKKYVLEPSMKINSVKQDKVIERNFTDDIQ